MNVLTARELAELLKVSLRTIQRYTRARLLPHFRIGPRTVRYSVAAIDMLTGGTSDAG